LKKNLITEVAGRTVTYPATIHAATVVRKRNKVLKGYINIEEINSITGGLGK
jgi:hypothetical protein